MFKIIDVTTRKARTKIVNFHGREFDVAVTAKWIAVNEDGSIMAYNTKPSIFDNNHSSWYCAGILADLLGKCVYEGDWTKSLVKIK
jgi:hypothetical protein